MIKANKGFFFTLLFFLLILGGQILSHTLKGHHQKSLTICKNNLKEISTAMEMYSTDWSGRYPTDLAQLVPEYIDEIPTCRAAGAVTYRMEMGEEASHNPAGLRDYFYLCCSGENHLAVSVPKDLPCRNSLSDDVNAHWHEQRRAREREGRF